MKNQLSAIRCQLSANGSGFTLIEIVMIIVVVSIAIPTLLIVLGQGARQSVDAELQVSATNVAQAMMEEIKTKRWDETVTPPPYTTPLGPEGTEDRIDCTGLSAVTPYDDVDDYNGYSEPCTWGGPSYITSVAVCYVAAADLNACLSAPTTSDFKRISVTVSNTSMGTVNLVTLVGNY
ncbi:MAG: hypothetical protein WC855_14560 [Thermodesulfovibrionales bacterium]